MYTILGGSGFVGRHLIRHFEEQKISYFAPNRKDNIFAEEKELGEVIDCIGVTQDFRSRILETVEAHVCFLVDFFKKAHFNSFLYLSSTRVYQNSTQGDESSFLRINSNEREDLYNLSKLLGESICLNQSHPRVRIVRLSNICGDNFDSNNFMYSIVKEAIFSKKIALKSSLDSAKDYITIDDVIQICLKIIDDGRSQLYNVASGQSITHYDLINLVQKYTQAELEVMPNARQQTFAPISIKRIVEEFAFVPQPVLPYYEKCLSNFISTNGEIL